MLVGTGSSLLCAQQASEALHADKSGNKPEASFKTKWKLSFHPFSVLTICFKLVTELIAASVIEAAYTRRFFPPSTDFICYLRIQITLWPNVIYPLFFWFICGHSCWFFSFKASFWNSVSILDFPMWIAKSSCGTSFGGVVEALRAWSMLYTTTANPVLPINFHSPPSPPSFCLMFGAVSFRCIWWVCLI